eukprot:CAMPEP_0197449558 /NCGR_PEP_ID=MMETSP1175-20131217/22050_1 /TAXON_ID=1003142 /ORGANISM="Triceratium dubium, Strain CCMP147" /LENGTH=141 /DNA_ID=CAMNT_0042981721 /DNA_START=328 /DNA_END=753 /DNA_ORIENTATION=-
MFASLLLICLLFVGGTSAFSLPGHELRLHSATRKELLMSRKRTEKSRRQSILYGNSVDKGMDKDAADTEDDGYNDELSQTEDEPLSFLGLSQKQEVDSLDNGLVFLGPIILVVQLLVMYEMVFGSEVPVSFGGPPPLPPNM